MLSRTKRLALDTAFRSRMRTLYCSICGGRIPLRTRSWRRNCDACAGWALGVFRRLRAMLDRAALAEAIHGATSSTELDPKLRAVLHRCSESARARHRARSGWSGAGFDV